jgi:hypothetical protein
MAAGSIVIELLLRTGSFVTDTARAGKSLKSLKKEAEEFGKAIGLAFGLAATAATAYAKSQINQLDALNDLSDATGSTIENLSALEDVARRNGQTLDDVSGIVIKFNKALSDVDGKNDASKAFAALGLNFKELQDLDPAEALRQTAVALAGFADDGNKARIVQELFGKSIKEAGPFLKDLAEQGKLNAKVTTEQAKAAEEFNKQLFAAEKNTADFARSLLSDLLPALNTVFREIREGGLSKFLDDLDRGLGLTKTDVPALKLLETTKEINDAIAETSKSLAKLKAEPDNGNVFRDKGIAALEKRLAELRAESVKTEAAMVKLDATLNPKDDPSNYSNEGRNKRSLGPLPKDTTKTTDPFDALIKSAREMLALSKAEAVATDELSDAQKTKVRIQADLTGGTLKLSDAQKKLLFGTLDQADAQQRANDLTKRSTEATTAAISAREALLESEKNSTKSLQDEADAARLQVVQFGLSTEAIEEQAIARERSLAASKELAAIRREEKDDLDPIAKQYREQARAIRDAADSREYLLAKQKLLDTDPLTGASKAVQDYLDTISKTGRATYDVVRQAAEGVEDILVSSLNGGDVRAQAKALVNQLISEFYRLAIIRPFLQSLGLGSGGGGFLASLFGSGGNTSQSGPTGGVDFSGIGFPLAKGIDSVPYDGFPAILHQGERVLTKAENQGSYGGGKAFVLNLTNNGQPVTARETGRREDSRSVTVNAVLDIIEEDAARGGRGSRALSRTFGLNRAAGAPKRG